AVRSEIDRTIDRGRYNEAIEAATALLNQAQKAGETAYEGADYDLAGAHFMLGRALKRTGSAQAAIARLDNARQRFQALGATRMVSVALSDKSDCLTAIGRYDEAAKGYQEAVDLAEEVRDLRSVAINKGQLATVRMFQKKYPEALKLYGDARDTFERL